MENPRESDLMRDQPVPPHRFFNAPRGTPGSANRRTIDTPQIVHVFDLLVAQSREDCLKRRIAVPLVEQPPHRLPWTELLG